MRVVILAIGSGGDVQPDVALGKGLQQFGHEVYLATSDEFVTLVASHGLGFRCLGSNPRALIEGEAGLAWLESGRNPVAFVRRLARLVEPLWEQFLDDCCVSPSPRRQFKADTAPSYLALRRSIRAGDGCLTFQARRVRTSRRITRAVKSNCFQPMP